jgi:thiol-disulfide isomerase/thioredoxin
MKGVTQHLKQNAAAGSRRAKTRLSRSLLLLALLLVVPFPIGFAARARQTDAPAPDFTLPTRDGTVSLRDLRGKVVYVDFWASWCQPCRRSFPWMGRMSEAYAKQGLAIVSINLDKNRDAADAFLDQFPTEFKVAFDPAGKTAEAFHVEAMPSSFIVSRTGRIVYGHAGFEPDKADAIEDRIKEELSK